MRIQKAVITAAGRNQRTLPLQTLIDRDGEEKTVLRIILDTIRGAGVHDICVVIAPGDEESFARAAGDRSVEFITQSEPRGYAHAICSAMPFTKGDSFLHLVGDHLYVGNGINPAQRLVEIAEEADCSISAVQATRESLLPLYGAIGGHRLSGKPDLYRVETVIEKPTPTEAEQKLTISGFRAGHYLCFFGMHVFTPRLLEILPHKSTLSEALAELAGREQYLALEQTSRRYDVGVKYGLFRAQLALALSGTDRNQVLAQLLEVVALSTTETHEIGQGA
jgi:UTP--glucose-1-phosphate uridylyltransferase